MRYGSAVRLALATAMVISGVVVGVLPTTAVAQPPTGKTTSSTMTVKGTGRFADVAVTVGQTKGLINQTVNVSWTGADPGGSHTGKNFMQLMQCWGDQASGPDPTQCQYGVFLEQLEGNSTGSRGVSYHELFRDPKQPVPPGEKPDFSGTGSVAFQPVNRDTPVTGDAVGEFFDASTTNEVQVAPTRDDGRGEVDFEVQTGLEAAGLGCGQSYKTGPDTGKPRRCWLVVVPRDDLEVTGKKVGPPAPEGHLHGYLDSSPLSASNFVNRIAVPLEFNPVGQACPIGAAERPLTGHELVADAVLRWQPALCANNGPIFGYAQVADRLARNQLASPDPGLVFTSNPLEPEAVQPDRPVVYAPVAVSGLGIGFMLERKANLAAPPDELKRNGEVVTELNLTPRLVAKLLTQSYANAIPGAQKYLKGNPVRLVDDKEFQLHNPTFKYSGALIHSVDALTPSVDLDVSEALWSWINADSAARKFLDGEPDEQGMVVNKHYLRIPLPVDTFPKADTTCHPSEISGNKVELCALDFHPLAPDLHEAGRATSRGDSLAKAPSGERDPLDPTKQKYKRTGRAPVGSRAQLAVVDTVTAARYGVPLARLRNAAGVFVAPTDQSLTAGIAEMLPTKIPGVLRTNPAAKADGAYPLPAVTYAATVPAALDAASGKDYANFLRFAAGPGQRSGDRTGELPLGYLPLPEPMWRLANQAAATIERDAGKQAPAEEIATEEPVAAEPEAPAPAVPVAEAPAPAPAPEPVAPPSSVATQPVAAVRDTPVFSVGWMLRNLLAGLLIVGGLATGANPLLQRLGARMRRGGNA